jgi:hypothetical protein
MSIVTIMCRNRIFWLQHPTKKRKGKFKIQEFRFVRDGVSETRAWGPLGFNEITTLSKSPSTVYLMMRNWITDKEVPITHAGCQFETHWRKQDTIEARTRSTVTITRTPLTRDSWRRHLRINVPLGWTQSGLTLKQNTRTYAPNLAPGGKMHQCSTLWLYGRALSNLLSVIKSKLSSSQCPLIIIITDYRSRRLLRMKGSK